MATIVQSKSAACDTAITLDSNVTAGNHLIAEFAYRFDLDVTLSGGGTWQSPQGYFTNGNGTVKILFAENVSGGSVTVTPTIGTGAGYWTLREVSGLQSSSSVEAQNEGSVVDTSAPYVPGLSLSTTVSTYITVVASDLDNDSRTCTGGAGDITNITSMAAGAACGYATAVASGTRNAALTFDLGDTWAMQAYAFKEAGGGAYTLTADSGSFTETGVAANLVTTRSTVGGTGIFSLTGVAANLTKSGSPTNYTLTANLGLFSLNGQANNLAYSVLNPFSWDRVLGNEGYRIKWGQTSGGPYTETADNATNDETYDIYAPYRTTWYAVVAALVGGVEQEYSTERIFTSGIPDLNGDASSYTFTGNAAGLSKGYVVTANPSSYTITGFNTGLLKTNQLQAIVASFTYTGNDANLNYTVAGSNYTLPANAGSFSLTGVNTTLATGYVMSGLVSTYTITRINTNLLYSGAPVTGGGRGNRCHIRVGLHL